MTPRQIKLEQLTQATHSNQFAVDHLRAALKHADPLEGILLLDLIASAATLHARLVQFHDAVRHHAAATIPEIPFP